MQTLIITIVSLAVLVKLGSFLHRLYNNCPSIWARAINKFSKADQQEFPPQGAALFVGSSSIRFWESLEQDMAPLPVINRGFGGSMIHQVIHYADRIVLPYRPKAIFFYAGENDISGILFTRKHSAEQVLQNFQTFCEKVHQQLPDVTIHFISIKPPKTRMKYWGEMQRANQLIETYCNSDPRLHYIDIVPAMLNDKGETRVDLLKADGIHLNESGYAIWARVIKPLVSNVFPENNVDSLTPQ